MKFILYISVFSMMLCSCGKYLDVVPDGVATIENAFTSRTTAEKYLFTCYSYMPEHGNPATNTFMAGDEFWLPYPQTPQFYYNDPFEYLARGNQGIVSPRLNYWEGATGGQPLFQGLRDCNIFLENIETVPGMQEREKKRWIAEVKFLKAYYHFWLLRMYGPIPLIRENLDISTGVDDVQVAREPVDSAFNYVITLLDEAAPDLPMVLENENDEHGRITRLVLLSVKAKILVEAASPLFNGNSDFASFSNPDGELLFSSSYDPEKWKRAADACKEAIEACHSAGLELYVFNSSVLSSPISDLTATKMSIRNSVAERWNSEIIWGNTNSLSNSMQALSQARVDPEKINNAGARSLMAPTLKIAELYYTENGVPIDEDTSWDYENRYTIKTAEAEDSYNLEEGYPTASLHFDRESRFYASLGFDGGTWYGQGQYDDTNAWTLHARAGGFSGRLSVSLYSVTGYWPKKLVHFQNLLQPGDGGGYSIVSYPWPVMRLAGLYLLYAEALNEYSGPSPEVYNWINLVRERAGLKSVEESWTNYSKNSTKYTNKDGLRSIIHQERSIELAFEGHRYWDIRRWKKAQEAFSENIQGWDIGQQEPELYYRVRTLFTRQFTTKEYFWPISEASLIRNKKLVQNPGW